MNQGIAEVFRPNIKHKLGEEINFLGEVLLPEFSFKALLQGYEKGIQFLEIIGNIQFQKFFVEGVFDFGVGCRWRKTILEFSQSVKNSRVPAVNVEEFIRFICDENVVMVGVLYELLRHLSEVDGNFVISPHRRNYRILAD